MGKVYRAEQLDADGRPLRQVALKTLLPQYSVDPHFVRRFLREVRVAMQLRSPHTVTVYDSGRDEEALVEGVEGLSVKPVLEREG